jgi:hypothetical protein
VLLLVRNLERQLEVIFQHLLSQCECARRRLDVRIRSLHSLLLEAVAKAVQFRVLLLLDCSSRSTCKKCRPGSLKLIPPASQSACVG